MAPMFISHLVPGNAQKHRQTTPDFKYYLITRSIDGWAGLIKPNIVNLSIDVGQTIRLFTQPTRLFPRSIDGWAGLIKPNIADCR